MLGVQCNDERFILGTDGTDNYFPAVAQADGAVY
jgi:hypothetical protein